MGCYCSVHEPGPGLTPGDHVRDTLTILRFIIRVLEHSTRGNGDTRRRRYFVTAANSE